MNDLNILNINRHRMYIDGKGINTLIGLNNCPLNCKYCINKPLIQQNKYSKISITELLDYVILDYGYFIVTGGGVTFGGGEPLLQYKAIKEFREILPNDIPINIETSLNIPLINLETIIEDIEYLIIDIKTLDDKIYLEYTNCTLDNVINNLKYIQSKNFQDKCLIRVPDIPNYTTKNSIDKTEKLLKDMGFKNFDRFEYIIQK